MPEPTHIDVAAYALGGLDQHEDEAFRDHLDECPTCWAELERMVDVTSLLARLDPAEVLGEPEKPGPQVLDGMLRQVRVERRQKRYRTVLSAAAAVVLIVAGPVLAANTLGSDDKTQAPAPPVAAAPTLPGKVFEATQAGTGVKAKVGVERKAWGTNVGLELRGLEGPKECKLVAISKDNEEQTVSTWSVPPRGYGVQANPRPLVTTGGAGLFPNEIERFEVRTLDGENLVTVPVSA
jgi:Putative zinc-finger